MAAFSSAFPPALPGETITLDDSSNLLIQTRQWRKLKDSSFQFRAVVTINPQTQSVSLEINSRSFKVPKKYKKILSSLLQMNPSSITIQGSTDRCRAKISQQGMKVLGKALKSSSLTTLRCQLYLEKKVGQIFAKSLEKHPTLSLLDMRCSTMDASSVQALSESIPTMPNLTKFSISLLYSNFINTLPGETIIALFSSLKDKPHPLTALEFSYAGIEDPTITASLLTLAAEAIESPSLQELRISNLVSGRARESVTGTTTRSLSGTKELTTQEVFFPSRGHSGRPDLREIGNALLASTSLEVLDLSNNGIQDAASMTELEEALRTTLTLKKFVLQYNTFGPETLKILAGAIAGNSSITCLDLSFLTHTTWPVASAGYEALGTMLRTNRVLKELHLARKQYVGEDPRHMINPGISFLAAALNETDSTSLEVLDLTGHTLTVNQYLALYDAAEKHPSLISLGTILVGFTADPTEQKRLQARPLKLSQFLSQRKGLRSLDKNTLECSYPNN